MINKIKHILFVYLTLQLSLICSAQLAIRRPISQFSDQQTFELNVAASSKIESKFFFYSHYQNQTGDFKLRRNLSLYGDIKTTETQRLNFNASSNQEGPFLSLNRLHLGYNSSINLFQNFSMAVGSEIGIIHLGFQSSSGGPGGSDIGYDGTVSLYGKGDKNEIGASLIQYTSVSLQPINQELKFGRYIDLFYTQHLTLQPSLNLDITGRIQSDVATSHLGIAYFTFLYNEYLLTGLNVTSDLSFAPKIGIKLKNNKTPTDFFVSFIIPTSKNPQAQKIDFGIKISSIN